jgi:hypothetical protein
VGLGVVVGSAEGAVDASVDVVVLDVESVVLAVDSGVLAVDSVVLAVDSGVLAVESGVLAVESGTLAVDVVVLGVESVLLVDPLLGAGSLDVVEELVPEPPDELSDVVVEEDVELEVSLGVDELVGDDVDEPPDDGLEDWLGACVVDEPPDDGLAVELSVGGLVGSGEPAGAPPAEAAVFTIIDSDAGDECPAASFATTVNVYSPSASSPLTVAAQVRFPVAWSAVQSKAETGRVDAWPPALV